MKQEFLLKSVDWSVLSLMEMISRYGGPNWN
ncbi:hypothetical protein Gotri_007656, partial [Gossypium trilobum]|nr:hypothetical protein [Gossypium trilobum]